MEKGRYNMIDKLVKLANHLDARGFYKEANFLDSIIKRAGDEMSLSDEKALLAGKVASHLSFIRGGGIKFKDVTTRLSSEELLQMAKDFSRYLLLLEPAEFMEVDFLTKEECENIIAFLNFKWQSLDTMVGHNISKIRKVEKRQESGESPPSLGGSYGLLDDIANASSELDYLRSKHEKDLQNLSNISEAYNLMYGIPSAMVRKERAALPHTRPQRHQVSDIQNLPQSRQFRDM